MTNDAPTTILVLLRHGDAGDALAVPELDARRGLTPRGHKQARRAGKALRRMGWAPHGVWTSRLRRAQDTVVSALAACGAAPRIVRTASLSPDANPLRTAKALAGAPRASNERTGPVVPPTALAAPQAPAVIPPVPVRWVVGHDPHLTRLLAHLLGAAPETLRLPKGAFAVVSLDARGPAAGAGTLLALVPADVLKAVTRKKRKRKPKRK